MFRIDIHVVRYLAVMLLLSFCLTQFAPGDARPATAPAHPIETLPTSRGGQDVVGSRMPSPPKFTRWLAADSEKPAKPPRATLYRWWTDGCPFCATTLPAVETLRKTYGEKGLRVVAVYHPKPPREVSDEQIRKFAERLGYHGAIAVDMEWSVLKDVYLSKGDRRATSISLLADADGVIRFVHPGTEYFPSSKPENAQEDADYKLIEKAITVLLADRH